MAQTVRRCVGLSLFPNCGALWRTQLLGCLPSLWGALPPLLGPDGDIVCHSLSLPGFLGYHYATLHSGRTVLPQFDANFRARPPGRGGLRHGQAQLRGL